MGRGRTQQIMSPVPMPFNDIAAVLSGNERRSVARYPVSLQLRYKPIDDDYTDQLGFGRTIDVSSRGVLFEADDLVPKMQKIELALAWPVRLDGSCFLQLIMRGSVVRLDDRKIAMHSESYEFRTASPSAFIHEVQPQTVSSMAGVVVSISEAKLKPAPIRRKRRQSK